jgi:hypothetical protein
MPTPADHAPGCLFTAGPSLTGIEAAERPL